jgi:hypothetical protein
MAEGIAEVLTKHGTWRYTNGAGSGIVCSGCGEPVGNVIAHQATVLAANGYGNVREAQAYVLREVSDLIEPFSGIGLANGATRAEVANWLRARALGIEKLPQANTINPL